MSVLIKGSQVYARLLSYARRYSWALILGIIGTMLMSLTEAGFTWLLKPILDKGFIDRDPHFIRWLPLGIIIVFALRGFASFISNYYMAWAGRQVVMQLRQELFRHLLRLPAKFYDQATSGQLLSALIYNVDQVAKASTDSIVTLVQETVFIFGLLIVMFTTSWQISLLFLISIPLVAWIAKSSSRRMRHLSSSVQQSMADITHVAQEAIEGYQVIRTFGGSQYEIDKFDAITYDNRNREMKITATNNLSSTGVQFVAVCVIALTMFLGTHAHTHVTAGGFTSMMTAMLALLKPLRNLTTVNSTIQKGIASAASIFTLLDLDPEIDHGTMHCDRVRGKIEYHNVSFAYHEEGPAVLQHINLKVEPGQRVALVGRSGSGKTTIANLLPRFYDGFQGAIKIDDMDIRSLCLSDLRQQFAYVSQHVTLFNDTIAHNIAYGRWGQVSEAQICQAAEAAHAMEFIEKLPQGLQTRVGQNGVLLSGGQRQRLAIARALLKDAPILILDEATSALDTESERLIQAALEKLMTHRTTLVIAHRLSTIERADHIVVLEGGRIVEQGTHQQLLLNSGAYAKLHAKNNDANPSA